MIVIDLSSVKLTDAAGTKRAKDSPHLVSALDDDWSWQILEDGDREGNASLKEVENVLGCFRGRQAKGRMELTGGGTRTKIRPWVRQRVRRLVKRHHQAFIRCSSLFIRGILCSRFLGNNWCTRYTSKGFFKKNPFKNIYWRNLGRIGCLQSRTIKFEPFGHKRHSR